jgi:hypothetical protein
MDAVGQIVGRRGVETRLPAVQNGNKTVSIRVARGTPPVQIAHQGGHESLEQRRVVGRVENGAQCVRDDGHLRQVDKLGGAILQSQKGKALGRLVAPEDDFGHASVRLLHLQHRFQGGD